MQSSPYGNRDRKLAGQNCKGSSPGYHGRCQAKCLVILCNIKMAWSLHGIRDRPKNSTSTSKIPDTWYFF